MLTAKSILTIISSVLSLVQFFVNLAKSRDDKSSGQIELALAILAKARQDIDIARGIETTISESVKSDPGSMSRPDEFTRPD